VFFSNVSHEFRTPLTLLLGPAEEALARADALPAADLARWQLVHRSGLRLLKLVNTLLDFSRIEAGRVEATYQPTELDVLTRDLVSVFRAAIESAGLRLDLHVDPLGEPVFVDHEMWEKIVFNLLSNALKFTFEGAITITLRREGDHAALTVRDTGVGVPAGELPRLFDRFHRVPGARSRTHEGTGIGLSLAQDLVKLHGGVIRVESVVDVGSSFTVSLPFGSAHLPDAWVTSRHPIAIEARRAASFLAEASLWAASRGDVAAAAERGSTPDRARILVVDDNVDMRAYLARILGERWSVDVVADGDAALARARDAAFDLVLTDVMMPGLDGLELLRALRTDERTRAVPIIFLSGRAGEEARIDGLTAGADDYLVKPFSARELVARVHTHLELSRARLEAERERRRLYSHFMQAPVAVSVVLGPDLVFDLANPRYEQMVGRPIVVGRTLRAMFPELPADAPLFVGLTRVVTDTGVGIAPEMLPVVFDMFVQEQQSIDRSQGGLGLGLAIVRNLVVAHGGSVAAYSAGKGLGSELTVRLPAAAPKIERAPGLDPPPAPATPGLRILVVDDSEDIARMSSLALRRLGHTIQVAHDGPSALQIVEDFRPDVALVDIGLPVMDGYELARRLRAVPSLAKIRLVAVTGYGQDADRDRSHAAGFDVHLVKPVDRARYKAVLDQLTAERTEPR
jgi:signal transduction histidine kinase/CheY-like chemotaxis protein